MFDGYVLVGLAGQHLHRTFGTVGFVVRTTDRAVNPWAHPFTLAHGLAIFHFTSVIPITTQSHIARVNIYVETNRVKCVSRKYSHKKAELD